ncbi:CfaE/CblD family pilus tip adhesin [Pseudocitrobacter cyperus]|uniref:CfaE/CblD family pilus tip adhesin n=1 Tax=Pseudocitrobacter cyperus TaxID=3112843 RepID=A0ABV0HJH9_9ENTR
MKLTAFLGICGLMAGVSGYTQAVTPVGPTLSVSTLQEYEIPSGAPADVYLWDRNYPGEANYSAGHASYYCSDASIQQTCTHQSNGTTISMVLTEKRSHMQHRLTLQAYIENAYYDSSDPANVEYCAGKRAINSYNAWSCYNDVRAVNTNTKLLTVYITQSEMNALPIGGVWEGQLKLQYDGGNDATYTADITLKGKSTGKQDIFFPEFNGANPLVQLDLHPTGSVTGNSFVEDVTNLDMCLYDGYNSNSDSMTLSFNDEGKAAPSRRNGYFSIYNTTTGGTDEAERIDYRVEMFNPHTRGWMSIANTNTFTLMGGQNGIDQIRPVRLPTITYPVLCAPTPLRLIVDKFRITDKAAGYYRGTLHVEFSPSLNSI